MIQINTLRDTTGPQRGKQTASKSRRATTRYFNILPAVGQSYLVRELTKKHEVVNSGLVFPCMINADGDFATAARIYDLRMKGQLVEAQTLASATDIRLQQARIVGSTPDQLKWKVSSSESGSYCCFTDIEGTGGYCDCYAWEKSGTCKHLRLVAATKAAMMEVGA